MFGPMPILYRAEQAERAEPNPQLSRLGKDRAEQSPLPGSGQSLEISARYNSVRAESYRAELTRLALPSLRSIGFRNIWHNHGTVLQLSRVVVGGNLDSSDKDVYHLATAT